MALTRRDAPGRTGIRDSPSAPAFVSLQNKGSYSNGPTPFALMPVNDIPTASLTNRIRQLRGERKWSLRRLSGMSPIPINALRRMEKGGLPIFAKSLPTRQRPSAHDLRSVEHTRSSRIYSTLPCSSTRQNEDSCPPKRSRLGNKRSRKSYRNSNKHAFRNRASPVPQSRKRRASRLPSPYLSTNYGLCQEANETFKQPLPATY
jgi:hypothetical protein